MCVGHSSTDVNVGVKNTGKRKSKQKPTSKSKRVRAMSPTGDTVQMGLCPGGYRTIPWGGTRVATSTPKVIPICNIVYVDTQDPADSSGHW